MIGNTNDVTTVRKIKRTVIGLNLRQSKPGLVMFAFLLFRWCFSMLEKYYF